MNSKPQERPLVSFVLIAYNQEKYIREAVEGAFAQTYSPMEIILSDDCSPDRTFEIMQEMAEQYTGEHKVILNRNSQNRRLAGHVNYVLSLAKGDIMVLAAGDDISLAERAERSVEMLSDSTIAVSFETQVFKDENLEPIRKLDGDVRTYDKNEYHANFRFHVNGAARSFKRIVFDGFGDISEKCPTEDSVILLRSMLLGDVKKCNEVMVHYRVHGNNISSAEGLQKMDFRKIHEQYCRDLEKALAEGFINSIELEMLNKALEQRTDRIAALQSFQTSEGVLTSYFKYILCSPAIKPSEKFKLLLKSFL